MSKQHATTAELNSFYYFAYGSNMLRERMDVKNIVFVTVGCLLNHKLVFRGHGKRWGGAPGDIDIHPDEEVIGVVWRIAQEEKHILDLQECVQLGKYKETRVTVNPLAKSTDGCMHKGVDGAAGNSYECVTYVMNDKSGEGLPSEVYMNVLLLGALQQKLPDDYVAKLADIRRSATDSSMNGKKKYADIIQHVDPRLLQQLEDTIKEHNSFYYFAYGSNMLRERMGVKNIVFVAVGCLLNQKLVFRGHSKNWGGAPGDIDVHPDEEVIGVVWRIAQEEKHILDRQEGVQLGKYKETRVTVNPLANSTGGCMHKGVDGAAGNSYECVTYVMNDKSGEGLPSEVYIDVLLLGALQQKLPDDYVAKLVDIRRSAIDSSMNGKKKYAAIIQLVDPRLLQQLEDTIKRAIGKKEAK